MMTFTRFITMNGIQLRRISHWRLFGSGSETHLQHLRGPDRRVYRIIRTPVVGECPRRGRVLDHDQDRAHGLRMGMAEGPAHRRHPHDDKSLELHRVEVHLQQRGRNTTYCVSKRVTRKPARSSIKRRPRRRMLYWSRACQKRAFPTA